MRMLLLAVAALSIPPALAEPVSPALGAFAAPVGAVPAPVVRTAPPARPAVVEPPPSRATPRAPAPWDGLPAFDAGTVERIDRAIERQRGIVASGGWPMPSTLARAAEGSRGPEIAALRARLTIEGDLESRFGADSDVWDADLTAALRRFQLRHGLTPTGQAGDRTRRALATSAEARLDSLLRSRARIATRTLPAARYVVVNIPAATVEAVDGGEVRRRHLAVVGRAERASPEIDATITAVNLNPTWTVPPTILREDIAPRMSRDPGYLARQRIRVFEGGREVDAATVDWTSPRAQGLTLRQDPGAHNALGFVRIAMPNAEAVYLHDTPSRALFARDDRFHSSGCVRVEDVVALAAWLLDDTGVDEARLRRDIATGQRRDLRLSRPIPTHWVYLTAWATADGTVHFREDIYGLDGDRPRIAAAPARPARTARPPAPERRAAVDAAVGSAWFPFSD